MMRITVYPKIISLILFFLLGSALFYGQVVETAQAQVAGTTLDKAATKAVATAENVVQITWQINREPAESEGIRIIVLDSNNRTIVIRQNIIMRTGTINIRGKEGETYFVSVRDNANNELDRATVPVSKPATRPATREQCEQSGESFEFCDTLFGERVSAPTYIRLFYSWSVGIAILGATLMIIYAGYKYTMSRGNPSEINNAKEIIVSSLVGLALLLLSFTILRFLGVNVQ